MHSRAGRFQGLGIVLARPTSDAIVRGVPDEVVVVGASEQAGGAFSRGLRSGDVLLEVGGRSVVGVPLKSVGEMGAGLSPGAEVQLRLWVPSMLSSP